MDLCDVSLLEDSKRLGSFLSNKEHRNLVNKRNSNGFAPLHLAAYLGKHEAVKILLQHSADPNMKDRSTNQWTACHWAAITGNLQILLTLVQNGGKTDIEDKNGKTSFYFITGLKKDRNLEEHDLMLFTWGSGANFQLGHGTPDIKLAPKKVRALEGKQILHIAASKYHTAAVTQSGELYTWGFGAGGRLGHGDEDSKLFPEKVRINKRVVTAAVSSFYSAAVTDDGQLYTWGVGPLGHHPTSILEVMNESSSSTKALSSSPTGTTPVAMGNNDQLILLLPKRVKGPLENKTIVQIACSRSHCAAVTMGGLLFTWGSGDHGALGHGTFQDQILPREVSGVKDFGVTMAAVGSQHTLVLSNTGNDIFIFGFGKNYVRKVSLVPPKTPKPFISTIAASGIRSIAVAVEGQVYSWTGCGKEDNNRPQIVQGLEQIRTIKAAVGGSGHIVALSDTGQVYEAYHNKLTNQYPIHNVDISRAVDVAASKTHAAAIVASVAVKNIFKAYGLTQREDLGPYVNSYEFSDVEFTLLNDNSHVYGHMIILAARSKYFRKLFEKISKKNETSKDETPDMFGLHEPTKYKIEVNKNITKQMFIQFLRYLYTDHMEIPKTTEEVEQLTLLSNIYQLPNLSLLDRSAGKHPSGDGGDGSTYIKDLTWAMTADHLSDVSMEIEGNEVPAHKLILAARCSYFETMFRVGMMEASGTLINFEEMRFPIMKKLISFLYTDEITKLLPKDALELLMAADQLFLDDLKKICIDCIKGGIDISNVTDYLEVADMADASSLRDACFECIHQHIGQAWDNRLLLEMDDDLRLKLENYIKSKISLDTIASPFAKTTEKAPNNESNATTNEEPAVGTEDPAETLKKLRNLRKKLAQISQLEEKLKSGIQLDSEQQLKLNSKQKLTEELTCMGITNEQEEQLKQLINRDRSNSLDLAKSVDSMNNELKNSQEILNTSTNSLKNSSDMLKNSNETLKNSTETLKNSQKLNNESLKNSTDKLKNSQPNKTSTKVTTNQKDVKLVFGSVQSMRKTNEKPPQVEKVSPVKEQPKLPVTPPKQTGPAWGTSQTTPTKQSLADILEEEKSKKTPIKSPSKSVGPTTPEKPVTQSKPITLVKTPTPEKQPTNGPWKSNQPPKGWVSNSTDKNNTSAIITTSPSKPEPVNWRTAPIKSKKSMKNNVSMETVVSESPPKNQSWTVKQEKVSLKQILDQEAEEFKRKNTKIQVKNLRDIQREEILHQYEAGDDEDKVLKEVLALSLAEQQLYDQFL